MLHSFPFYTTATAACFYFESVDSQVLLSINVIGKYWTREGALDPTGREPLCCCPVSKIPSRSNVSESQAQAPDLCPSLSLTLCCPTSPWFHSRLREGHVLGVRCEEVSRRKALGKCLQAGVISPAQEANSHAAGRRKGFTCSPTGWTLSSGGQGRSSGEASWSGY